MNRDLSHACWLGRQAVVSAAYVYIGYSMVWHGAMVARMVAICAADRLGLLRD